MEHRSLLLPLVKEIDFILEDVKFVLQSVLLRTESVMTLSTIMDLLLQLILYMLCQGSIQANIFVMHWEDASESYGRVYG